jgi:uncharacterized protein (UPF0335 family)
MEPSLADSPDTGTAGSNDVNGIAASQLRQLIEKIERLEEEKKGLADDIRDIYAEAKGQGFDTKILRKVVSLRKKSREERQEEAELLELYLGALGEAV